MGGEDRDPPGSLEVGISNEESKAHARHYFEVPQLAEQGVNLGLLSPTNYTFRQASHTTLLTKNFCSFNSLENCFLRELM